MKKIIALLTLISFFAITPFAYAQGQGSGRSNQVQNQNQVNTQNQGEEKMLKVATQHMESLMDMEGLEEGTKKQVGELANSHKVAIEQANSLLSRAQSRKRYVKQLIGPDYVALRNLRKLIQQNQVRIRALNQVHAEVKNNAAQEKLMEAIKTMEDQNTQLEMQILREEATTSLLGWLFKLLSYEVKQKN